MQPVDRALLAFIDDALAASADGGRQLYSSLTVALRIYSAGFLFFLSHHPAPSFLAIERI